MIRGFVCDGWGQGASKAVRRVFGEYARCSAQHLAQTRKCGGKLKGKGDQEAVRQQLNDAYHQNTYDEAKQCLGSICEALQTEGQYQTARSLLKGTEYGGEETLTLHRLNVDKSYGGVCGPPTS